MTSSRLRHAGLLLIVMLAATVAGAMPGPADFDAWRRGLDAGTGAGDIVRLAPAIGDDLDRDERLRYHLLPGLTDFRTARLIRLDDATTRVVYEYGSRETPYSGSLDIPPEVLRLTRLHIWLGDLFRAQLKLGSPVRDGGDALRYTALRFASRARYDLVVEILQDLAAHYADTEAAAWAEAFLPDIRAIHRDHRTLIWDQTAGLGSGSNDLRFFGSYYGLWLGFALPLAFEADSPEPYGVGLIVGGPSGYLIADRIARSRPISEGRATILSLGANFGTWQGLGWAGYGDAESHDVVGTGIVAGLAGLGASIWLTDAYDFSEGHAALTESAMNWGAWYGLVVTGMMEDTDDEGLRNTLVGSALGVGVTGLAARGVDLTEKQVRLISLKGLLGTVMAFGVDLIARPNEGYMAWGVIGVGGAVGLTLGLRDALRDSDDRTAASSSGPLDLPLPRLTARSDPGGRPGLKPALVYSFVF